MSYKHFKHFLSVNIILLIPITVFLNWRIQKIQVD